jgi:predicted nuclease of predicted toxin-antitoxin system
MLNPKSDVGGDEMMQDAAPIGHEEEISVSKDTVISDEWPSRPADCVSKDADFHQRSLIFGHPPKLVFLRIGNCPTSRITELLRSNHDLLMAFDSDQNASILILP